MRSQRRLVRSTHWCGKGTADWQGTTQTGKLPSLLLKLRWVRCRLELPLLYLLCSVTYIVKRQVPPLVQKGCMCFRHTCASLVTATNDCALVQVTRPHDHCKARQLWFLAQAALPERWRLALPSAAQMLS